MVAMIGREIESVIGKERKRGIGLIETEEERKKEKKRRRREIEEVAKKEDRESRRERKAHNHGIITTD